MGDSRCATRGHLKERPTGTGRGSEDPGGPIGLLLVWLLVRFAIQAVLGQRWQVCVSRSALEPISSGSRARRPTRQKVLATLLLTDGAIQARNRARFLMFFMLGHPT